jgi:protein-tyrosine phosphatase
MRQNAGRDGDRVCRSVGSPTRTPERRVIDLHTHVLPGLDDGPADLDGSLAIAREAEGSGVEALAATPHVRDDYPTTPSEMLRALARVRVALDEARIGVDVLPGAEIAFDRLRGLELDELASFGLGGSPTHVLVEMPVFTWPLDAEAQVRRLRAGGMMIVLAHPERNVLVQESASRLAGLVRAGCLVQLTSASLLGGFGARAATTARTLVGAELAHMLASDTHGAGGRGTALAPAAAGLGDSALADWLTKAVPMAVIAGEPCPPRPGTRSGRLRLRRSERAR